VNEEESTPSTITLPLPLRLTLVVPHWGLMTHQIRCALIGERARAAAWSRLATTVADKCIPCTWRRSVRGVRPPLGTFGPWTAGLELGIR
jgi:hypothetical protein